MNKRAQIGMMVMIAIAIIVAIAIAVQVFNQQKELTSKLTTTNDTFNLTTLTCYTAEDQVNESNENCNITVTNEPTGWRQNHCPLTSVTVSNATDDALVLNTDYKLHASTGIVQMLNTSDTEKDALGQNVLVDYTWCAEGYNTDSGSRSIAATIGLFLVIALFIFVAGYVIKQIK